MSSLISVYTIHCIYSSSLLLCIVSTFYASQFWRKMLWKLSVYIIHPPTVHVRITFKPSRPHSSWEKCDKNILMFENWTVRKIKGQICSSHLIPVYMIHPPIVHVGTKFQPSRPHSSWEKFVTNIFNVWILEKEKIKGQISSSSLILVYTIHPPTVQVWSKFQPSRPHSSWQKCDEKFQCWKLERKKTEEIKGQNAAAAWFPYTWYICLLSMCVPNFNLLGLTVPEKSVTKNFNV